MRRALATVTLAGAFALSPVMAATASAGDTLAAGSPVTQSEQPDTDTDEPALQDGNDDTGKYGLIGLSGMLGLFGYRKYREHQANRSTTDGDGPSGRV